MKKAVQLITVSYTPEPNDTGVYFISNSGNLFRYTNEWDNHNIAFEDKANAIKFYLSEVKDKKQVLALPEQIGKIYRSIAGGISNIEVGDLQAILENQGMCFIEMEPITDKCYCPCHAPGANIKHIMACCNNGLVTIGQKIKMIDNKVIIHLSE